MSSFPDHASSPGPPPSNTLQTPDSGHGGRITCHKVKDAIPWTRRNSTISRDASRPHPVAACSCPHSRVWRSAAPWASSSGNGMQLPQPVDRAARSVFKTGTVVRPTANPRTRLDAGDAVAHPGRPNAARRAVRRARCASMARAGTRPRPPQRPKNRRTPPPIPPPTLQRALLPIPQRALPPIPPPTLQRALLPIPQRALPPIPPPTLQRALLPIPQRALLPIPPQAPPLLRQLHAVAPATERFASMASATAVGSRVSTANAMTGFTKTPSANATTAGADSFATLQPATNGAATMEHASDPTSASATRTGRGSIAMKKSPANMERSLARQRVSAIRDGWEQPARSSTPACTGREAASAP